MRTSAPGDLDMYDDDGGASPDPSGSPTVSGPAAATPTPTSGPTTTAGPDLAPVNTSGPETDNDNNDENDENDDEDSTGSDNRVYARRRRIRNALVAVAAIIGLFLVVQYASNPSSTAPDKVTQSPHQNAEVAPPAQADRDHAAQVLGKVVQDAQKWKMQYGTYRSFTAEGAQVAAGKDALVVAMVIDGRAWYTGVIPGQPRKVEYDETGQAVTQALIQQTQDKIDQSEQSKTEASVTDATASIARAVDTVQYYAQNNYVQGKPSFRGIASTHVDGVKIVSATADTVTLQAQAGDQCVTTEVTVDSATEPVASECQ
jgi:hypothetical protein